MKIESSKQGEKIILKVSLPERKKTESVIKYTTSDAISLVSKKYNLKESDNITVVSAPAHDLMNHTINLSGEWAFELKKEKPLDIPKKTVKIEQQIVEAIPPTEEIKKEASLFSEPLPYGLKSTATKTKAKKKKTTKKKTTEE